MPGPSTTWTPSERASRPSAAPTSRTRSGSHEEASVTAGGKHVEGRLRLRPSSSDSSGWTRSPCGPSPRRTGGKPSSGSLCRNQKSWPVVKAAFSATVICRSLGATPSAEDSAVVEVFNSSGEELTATPLCSQSAVVRNWEPRGRSLGLSASAAASGAMSGVLRISHEVLED